MKTARIPLPGLNRSSSISRTQSRSRTLSSLARRSLSCAAAALQDQRCRLFKSAQELFRVLTLAPSSDRPTGPRRPRRATRQPTSASKSPTVAKEGSNPRSTGDRHSTKARNAPCEFFCGDFCAITLFALD